MGSSAEDIIITKEYISRTRCRNGLLENMQAAVLVGLRKYTTKYTKYSVAYKKITEAGLKIWEIRVEMDCKFAILSHNFSLSPASCMKPLYSVFLCCL